MKIFAVFVLALMSITLTACTTEQRSPDQIRKETASATSAAARDAKAVAQGVVDGLKHGGTININKASETDLEKLPGIDETAARRIIANRPYDTAGELTKKHVISKSQYEHIADKITAR
jgi:DNA uptake protein ComE-like DNA-binding protein